MKLTKDMISNMSNQELENKIQGWKKFVKTVTPIGKIQTAAHDRKRNEIKMMEQELESRQEDNGFQELKDTLTKAFKF